MHHDPDLQRQAGETTTQNKLLALLKRWRWFGAFVILPSLLGTLYFGFIAADVYVSVSSFVIKAPNKQAASSTSIGSILQRIGLGGGQEQSNEIIGYLHSRDALADLSESIDVRAAFSSAKADPFSSFPQFCHSLFRTLAN